MIIKSFVADTVAGALKKARTELGGDAVILKTRKLEGSFSPMAGNRIEVTACVDQPQAPTAAGAVVATADETRRSAVAIAGERIPVDEIVQKLDFLIDVFQAPQRKGAFPGNVGRLFAALLDADFPEAIACETAERVAAHLPDEDDYGVLTRAAAEMLLEQLPHKDTSRPFAVDQKVALVGPAGGGKTSLMGRLAGYLLREPRLPVCLTSLDQLKLSAPEELQAYADILNVDHIDFPCQMDRTHLDSQVRHKVTLIDTPALNARDRAEIQTYALKLAQIEPDRIIGVFPAIARSVDLIEMMRAYRPLHLTELAVTMTDQTHRLGGIIALSIQSGLPVTILGTGRKADGLSLAPDFGKIIRECLGLDDGGSHD